MAGTTKVLMSHVVEVHRHLNKETGRAVDWYGPGAMRFFGTSLPKWAYTYGLGSYLFVTGERDTYGDGPRLFTIRIQLPDGEVETVGEFQQWDSREDATRFMLSLLETPEVAGLTG